MTPTPSGRRNCGRQDKVVSDRWPRKFPRQKVFFCGLKRKKDDVERALCSNKYENLSYVTMFIQYQFAHLPCRPDPPRCEHTSKRQRLQIKSVSFRERERDERERSVVRFSFKQTNEMQNKKRACPLTFAFSVRSNSKVLF